jgi:hypothetical protein
MSADEAQTIYGTLLANNKTSNLQPYTRTFANTPENAQKYGFTLPTNTTNQNSSINQSYLDELKKIQTQVNEKNAAREKEIRSIMDNIISMYQPGGGFGAGYEAQLNTQKTRDVASASQGLVSSGLSNTTNVSNLAKGWERDVGSPARLKLEDLRTQNLSSAMSQKANFIGSINESGVDYSSLMQMIMKGASA